MNQQTRRLSIGLVVYGSIDQTSGGYLYDRMLVKRLEEAGDEAEVISIDPPRRYLSATTGSLPRTGRRHDVVIIDELCHAAFALRRASPSAHFGCPVVALVHHLRRSESPGPTRRLLATLLERRFLAAVDGIIANSSSTKEETAALLAGAPEVPTVIAPPAGSRFAPQSLRPRKIAPGEPLRILFVGNLIPRKGLHTLIEALSLAAPRAGAGAFELTVVGSSDFDRDYALRVHRLASRMTGAASVVKVVFAGKVIDEELARLYSTHALLCVPSQFEGFGIVYLEAMHFGLPAIGSAGGGARDVIRHGENGYLVAADCPEELANVLVDIVRNPGGYERLSACALDTARIAPSWEESMDRIHRFLRDHFISTIYDAQA
jgi:glycosyltransferase involved in cell wall biosynthesis